MRFCFDIDGVVFKINSNYEKHEPIYETVNYMIHLKKMNHTIILYTARKMSTHNGNIGLINKNIVEKTLYNLNRFNIPFDEIYFGKPSADIYIDDKGLNYYDLKEYLMEPEKQTNNSIGIITYRLNEMEKKIEKNLENLLVKVDTLIEKINKGELKVNELKVKVDTLEKDVQDLKATDDRTKEDLNQIKVSMAEKIGWGALGGGSISILIKLFEHFSGGQ
jgi:capsule biosynthesis phosphatase